MKWQKYTLARLLLKHHATDINHALILLLGWRSDYKMNKEGERGAGGRKTEEEKEAEERKRKKDHGLVVTRVQGGGGR